MLLTQKTLPNRSEACKKKKKKKQSQKHFNNFILPMCLKIYCCSQKMKTIFALCS